MCFGFLRMCFIVVPQVVNGWVPQVGNGVVPQVLDGVGGVLQVGDGFAPQVVDVAVDRNCSCSSCDWVSAIWRICQCGVVR